jgi:hypothetical protein
MINNAASSGVHLANIAALRQNRAKKTEPSQDPAVETAKTQRAAHPAHPHGHIPPGLARAAEKIASKIFARADADASGTVTQQELSAVHSRHARTLASSDLFKGTTTQTPTDSAPATTIETEGETTEAPIETPAQVGITETQLKEALTKFFHAKVGATYTPPPPPTTEQPDPTAPADPTAPSIVDSVPEESASNQAFTMVA